MEEKNHCLDMFFVEMIGNQPIINLFEVKSFIYEGNRKKLQEQKWEDALEKNGIGRKPMIIKINGEERTFKKSKF